MATPLLCILDEAANVCRWKDLPDLYSHYGSRGIPIMSIFQSWSQGVECSPSPACGSCSAPPTRSCTSAVSRRLSSCASCPS
nr:TraG/TraD/VirD4 family protein [Curtobacterium sp. MCBD17_032]